MSDEPFEPTEGETPQIDEHIFEKAKRFARKHEVTITGVTGVVFMSAVFVLARKGSLLKLDDLNDQVRILGTALDGADAEITRLDGHVSLLEEFVEHKKLIPQFLKYSEKVAPA